MGAYHASHMYMPGKWHCSSRLAPEYATPYDSNLPAPALPPSAIAEREIPNFDREQANREGRKLYVPGPPFQFAVRTDKSIRSQDWTKMFPHYECVRDRVVLVPSYTTTSLAQSRIEVTRLYRKLLRNLPTTLTDYNAWHIPLEHAVNRIATEFRKNAHVRDTRVIDKLHQGRAGVPELPHRALPRK